MQALRQASCWGSVWGATCLVPLSAIFKVLPVLCVQAWALFKGKFREGIDKPDPPTWKTRLRCALNKSNDFEEHVERSQLDISDPYKVYRIIPEGAKKSQSLHQTPQTINTAFQTWKFGIARVHSQCCTKMKVSK